MPTIQIEAPSADELAQYQADDRCTVGMVGNVMHAEYPDPPAPPAERRQVLKSTIVARLQAQGKLDAAFHALQQNTYAYARWLAADWPSIFFDDPEACALFAAVGADVDAVMAP